MFGLALPPHNISWCVCLGWQKENHLKRVKHFSHRFLWRTNSQSGDRTIQDWACQEQRWSNVHLLPGLCLHFYQYLYSCAALRFLPFVFPLGKFKTFLIQQQWQSFPSLWATLRILHLFKSHWTVTIREGRGKSSGAYMGRKGTGPCSPDGFPPRKELSGQLCMEEGMFCSHWGSVSDFSVNSARTTRLQKYTVLRQQSMPPSQTPINRKRNGVLQKLSLRGSDNPTVKASSRAHGWTCSV